MYAQFVTPAQWTQKASWSQHTNTHFWTGKPGTEENNWKDWEYYKRVDADDANLCRIWNIRKEYYEDTFF